jgi:hypothetical protein
MRRAKNGTPEYKSNFWAFDRVWRLCQQDPEAAWQFILAVLAEDRSNKVLQTLSAGPLEDLLSKHPYTMIKRVEAEARSNPHFAKLLGGVWQNRIPDDVWRRVQAAWDRRGWDGTPE